MAVRSGGGGGQDAQYQNITRFLSIGTFYETNIYEKFRTYLGFKNFNPPVSYGNFIFYPIKVSFNLKLGVPSAQTNVRSGLTSDSN